jgi:hypothetical protein
LNPLSGETLSLKHSNNNNMLNQIKGFFKVNLENDDFLLGLVALEGI